MTLRMVSLVVLIGTLCMCGAVDALAGESHNARNRPDFSLNVRIQLSNKLSAAPVSRIRSGDPFWLCINSHFSSTARTWSTFHYEFISESGQTLFETTKVDKVSGEANIYKAVGYSGGQSFLLMWGHSSKCKYTVRVTMTADGASTTRSTKFTVHN